VVQNTGTQLVAIDPGMPELTVLYYRYQATHESGFTYINAEDEKVKVTSLKATQIAPGSKATIRESANVPTAQLALLAVQVDHAPQVSRPASQRRDRGRRGRPAPTAAHT
jgi:hypothetical protein